MRFARVDRKFAWRFVHRPIRTYFVNQVVSALVAHILALKALALTEAELVRLPPVLEVIDLEVGGILRRQDSKEGVVELGEGDDLHVGLPVIGRVITQIFLVGEYELSLDDGLSSRSPWENFYQLDEVVGVADHNLHQVDGSVAVEKRPTVADMAHLLLKSRWKLEQGLLDERGPKVARVLQ